MSEVASCSYEARSFGIRNGMYVRDARALCPHLTFLSYQFEEYKDVSKKIYRIVSEYTQDIRAVSCDEMYVDLKNLCNDMHIIDVMSTVNVIRRHIQEETGCAASVGIGSSVLIARLATRHAKPNGQLLVRNSEIEEFIKKERISDLPGIGYNMLAKLRENVGEMSLCGELQQVSLEKLQTLFGSKLGSQIYNQCRGIDKNRDFFDNSARKSISCDINYGIRFTKESELMDFIGKVSIELEKRLASARMLASSVTLKLLIRAAGADIEPLKYLGHGVCDSLTKSSRLPRPSANGSLICSVVKRLMKDINPVISDLRGIGVQLTNLTDLSQNRNGTVNSQTIRDFFAVRRTNQSYRKKSKKYMSQEDPFIQKAIKESLRDYRASLIDQGLSHYFHPKPISDKPKFKDLTADQDIKEEMWRMIRRSQVPERADVDLLTSYFYRLMGYQSIEDVVSQMRFLERKAIDTSSQWYIVVSGLKRLMNDLCCRMFGGFLFEF
ncbi:hypothetical protein AB6A40_009182 [Gnathostoma spinigerum]|uniref:DNA repair protein REV1 n=1 Tax=Gnathostoma spinigerum TaxID=75299 RepID=A0ABD6ERL0_9BILA